MTIVSATRASFYFAKTTDGRYLQAQASFSGPQIEWSFGLDPRRAWSPCCNTPEQAQQYIDGARVKFPAVEFIVVPEVL